MIDSELGAGAAVFGAGSGASSFDNVGVSARYITGARVISFQAAAFRAGSDQLAGGPWKLAVGPGTRAAGAAKGGLTSVV
ncbi:MAG: hypothetical protein HY329_12160 [Chloroflexi bacterium]|nr:hypothetical protein [Chloroflexota bacterium]